MNRFFKGCLIFFIGMVIGVLALTVGTVVICVSMLSSTKTKVEKNSYLIVDFDGEITERQTTEWKDLIGADSNQMQLLDYLRAIENAAEDPNIIGIIINGDKTFYTRSHAEEMSAVLKKFSGYEKPIYAWLSHGQNSNYYLCLNADKIYMPDTVSASLSLQGYSITSPYFKNMFDKAGIHADVIHIGDYKGSGENYSRDKMSNELRSSYIKVFDNIHDGLVNTIAADRHISRNALIRIMSSGDTVMMSPQTAKSEGFIDELMNYDEMKRQIIGKNNSISIAKYASTVKEPTGTNKIAVIYAEGTIVQGKSGSSRNYETLIGDRTFCNDIAEIAADKTVKAVVLRINSPGGSALASELMLQELTRLQKSKPIYVSFGPMAASGGYYISCVPGVKVFTTENTITGSIGVLSMAFNIEGLSEKLGINFETVKKYKYDDIFSASRKMNEDERQMIIRSMLGTYREFTEHVTEARGIDQSRLESLAQGRIWTGRQAIDNGLATHQGGLLNTLRTAASENGLSGYSLVTYPKPTSIIDELLDSTSARLTRSGVRNAAKETKTLERMVDYYLINSNAVSLYEPYIEAVK